MDRDPLQRLVEGWLAYHRAAQTGEIGLVKMPVSDELFQFVIDVDDLVRDDPERAWLVIQLIFAACRDDLERACLAAGPLEDLLAKHGPSFIDRVEQAAANDNDFRELLVGVWRNGIDHPIWERLQRAAGTA
jgi:uncharacterized protein DUF6869